MPVGLDGEIRAGGADESKRSPSRRTPDRPPPMGPAPIRTGTGARSRSAAPPSKPPPHPNVDDGTLRPEFSEIVEHHVGKDLGTPLREGIAAQVGVAPRQGQRVHLENRLWHKPAVAIDRVNTGSPLVSYARRLLAAPRVISSQQEHRPQRHRHGTKGAAGRGTKPATPDEGGDRHLQQRVREHAGHQRDRGRLQVADLALPRQ